ncbi:RnfABCDGE type electron transport complex subunit B [Fusobacterium canifelinum]|uniref:RnfABCDGE type electron transport complex subunit B n=1 Tax=Fusobacterium canifelinum TaxID=285729 RepID=A0A3P1UXW3_9FUSO|nr:RnfABCDGE type electron transport complex subunit B [Fusobacterium canifelinum]RRD26170.1 RnfABCDGE type electron transport complex subunit B [Fusobacterium canifelinum]
MEAIMMPVVILGITGILMGLFLAYASKKFEVEVDPKVEAILAILPGVNCGACGYPGCSGYASGVALEGAKMTLCAPGGPKVAQKIGDIMGVAVEVPVKKKPAAKKPVEKKETPKVQTGEPISASQEFIEKNKRMLMKFKEAFDAGDKEGYEKLENLAKMAKKDELLKYYEEIKAGKIVPDGSVPVATGTANANAISASKEFVEKNKRMLMKFKEAFDAGDKEGFEKLENLAKMAKKDELLKYYEEIKAGKIVPDPATMVDAPATKEETPKVEDSQKQEASYCSVLGDGLCVPEQNEKVKEDLKKQAAPPKTAEELEKEKQAASYCSVLGDGLCVPEQNEQIVKQNLHQEIDKEMK